MANDPAEQMLPLFYKTVVPLNSQAHIGLNFKDRIAHPFAAGVHAVPVTVDEFVLVQRHYPIVFGQGDNSAPLALMGLQEGENLFVDADGTWREGVYVPAYVRRYPFLLAKLTPDAKDLSLCFDEESGYFGANEEGKLFAENGEASDLTKSILQFCEQFEMSIQRTRAFMAELREQDLLADGEASIQQGDTPAAVFRGFNMVGEDKIREMRGDKARKLVQSGAMGLIYAHFFSLSHMRELFAQRQARQAG
jgi:SapC